MKHYPKIRNQQIANETPKIQDIPVSDISISRLIEDGLLVLYREVKNLLITSSKGKLTPTEARDLRDHLKLLFELKDRENNLLDNLSDEALDEIANADQ